LARALGNNENYAFMEWIFSDAISASAWAAAITIYAFVACVFPDTFAALVRALCNNKIHAFVRMVLKNLYHLVLLLRRYQ
jgi:hypothetical protein